MRDTLGRGTYIATDRASASYLENLASCKEKVLARNLGYHLCTKVAECSGESGTVENKGTNDTQEGQRSGSGACGWLTP